MANKKIKSVDLLPEFLRTDKNSKFLSSTIDQLIEPPQLERVDGFIGSKLTPTYVSTTDNYIPETLSLRKNYQLEPALVVKDNLGNINNVVSIDDLVNEITVSDGIGNNFDRLFRSKSYSYNPHIDWDKFVNYQDYYWLTTGPELVVITGDQSASISTYSVKDNALDTSWIFSPDGLTEDPVITLFRGGTYTFNVDSKHKFYIKTSPSLGAGDLYQINISNNGASQGNVTLEIDNDTPATLYYSTDDNPYFQGQILVKTASENSKLDVESEILGKEYYISGTGVQLSNGMKIAFGGEVSPAYYQDKQFFVEGVGTAIRLVNYDLLTTPESFASVYNDNFDAAEFDEYPFDNFKKLPIVPEYVTINRASLDLNPWSRYNRWVHKDVIESSALYNNLTPVYPADKSARRPIIEFNADLQLFNFGSIGVEDIDIIDDSTTDAFSFVEGATGYFSDEVQLEQGNRIIFNADLDPNVRNKIYVVNFVKINNQSVIRLVAEKTATYGMTLVANLGTVYAGTSWWYNGTAWKFAQQHTVINQAPLFDLFDSEGVSYSDITYNSNFAGNKIFGYDSGTVYDPVLGFNIKYKSNATTGVGSWLFKNYFTTDTISIIDNTVLSTISSSSTFAKLGTEYVNVWSLENTNQIPILQLQTTVETTARLELTSINSPTKHDLLLDVYANNIKLSSDQFTTSIVSGKYFVNFSPALLSNTNVLFKIKTDAVANDNGWYETPISLTNNPLNGSLGAVTFTEMSDHYNSMINAVTLQSNIALRDMPNVSQYGTRLISSLNPIAFANFFIGTKEHSAIDSIVKSGDQYNQFKMAFLKKITEIDIDIDPITAVDVALKDLNKDKDINTSWHGSDMAAYGSDKIGRSWTVTDARNNVYPITEIFDSSKLSNRSVLVYLNGEQLILEKDYKFVPGDSAVEFINPLLIGDKIVINDYTDTTGSYIPATPTKLGLYPKFEPAIYIDDTYLTPIKVIQGHDGSITVAYNDYRDAIILELEKRIYNNIKASYRSELLDINTVLPGAFRNNLYSTNEISSILQQDFIKWVGFYGIDYTSNPTFDEDNALTWNYSGGYNAALDMPVNGSWRAVYDYFYDTDRPHTHPWEMLGFTNKPLWWDSEYGEAPYTSGNANLWNDIELGIIRQGARAGTHVVYARDGLSDVLPVDAYGNLTSPDVLITGITLFNRRQSWSFGEFGPGETAWRRSSYWPFAVQRLLALTQPASYAALMYDPSRINSNIAGQWTYGSDQQFLTPKNIEIFELDNTLTSGYSVYISEIGRQRSTTYLSTLRQDLDYIDFNLFHKVGGFVSKYKLQISIDAVAPKSTSPGALLPQEDYSLILNVSNPIKSVNISGIIVQKSGSNFVIKGYDKFKPYFTIYTPIRNSGTRSITIGGISESYVTWAPSTTGGDGGLSSVDTTTASPAPSNHFYREGQIVRNGNAFYRVKISHLAESSFNPLLFQQIPELPVVGGVSVQTAVSFSNSETQISYGTLVDSIQGVYDIIIGYGKWLESQGFIFDEYNQDLLSTVDWNLSGQEFLYWTTQNWSDNNIITLSPFANKIQYSLPNSVVDNVFDSFYNYSLLNASGLPFSQTNLNVTRDNGVCTIESVNTRDGIYFAKINSVQKEHAIVFNNTTIFNDVVYDIESGYRQRRMRIGGFKTANWDGDYFSPGFIYDDAATSDWKRYTDYKSGDVVRFSGKYYSAINRVVGASKFDSSEWALLNSKPVADLLPNFDYKINQFEDFYSLDIDNFDTAQQKMAQHLIGYTPRVYLNNVFTNPIAQYKFYQGYIKEKGTKNAISKLAKATIHNLQGELGFTEEWAFRIGHYGSFESYQEIEFPLVEGAFIENPQIISLVDNKPIVRNGLIQYFTPSELVISPTDLVPSSTFATTSTDIFKIDVAGYVNANDVDYQTYNIADLLSFPDNRLINEGDVFWIGFAEKAGWDILRYSRMFARITNVEVLADVDELQITTDIFHELNVGDVISISQLDSAINGIHVVKSLIDLDKFTIDTVLTTTAGLPEVIDGAMFKFTSGRHATFDNLPSDQTMVSYPIGTKFWIDNTDLGDNDWRVYEKIKNYSGTAVNNSNSPSGQQLGYTIIKNNELMLVGAPKYATSAGQGAVFVYTVDADNNISRRSSFSLNANLNNLYDNAGASDFGSSIAYAPGNFNNSNYGLIFTGAPGLSRGRIDSLVPGVGVVNGTMSNTDQQGGVTISSIDPVTLAARTEAVILSTDVTLRGRFGESVAFNATNNTLLVGAPGESTVGVVHVYSIATGTSSVTVTYLQPITTSTQELNFGKSISTCDSDQFVVGAPGDTGTGKVFVYSSTDLVQVISPDDILVPGFKLESLDYGRFGDTVMLSKDGNRLFVTSPAHRNQNQSFGSVIIYSKKENGQFDEQYPQVLFNPISGIGMQFGVSIDYNADSDLLAISSVGTNNSVYLTFDQFGTIYDAGSTTFLDSIEGFGTVYVYNRAANGIRYVLAEELQPVLSEYIDADTGDRYNNRDGTRFGSSILVDQSTIYVGAPGGDKFNQFHQFSKIDAAKNSLDIVQQYEPLVDVDIIEKVALLDIYNDTVIEYLDVIDPVKGKIAGIADQEIKFKSAYDPAVYSVGTANTINDATANWTDNNVGDIWWDLSTVKYTWYEQGDPLYRKNNWGKLFPGSTIDIYEWVGSDYLPSEWAVLADTPVGLTSGISGQPLYPDNSVMSIKQVYNSAANSFSEYYYFWVKNKVTVPNSKNRRLSAYQVSGIILDPTAYGLRYISVIDTNSLSIANSADVLVSNRVHLNVGYDNIKNNIPRHTEWLLLQEGSANSRPNALLEKKLLDSLLGHDSLGNPVPDPTLSDRMKYGIGIRPRQSIFKDRKSALRNLIEFSNSILLENRITDNYVFSNLEKQESAPDEFSYAYDQVIEDNEGLLLVDTSRLKTATLTCSVENGKIISVTITDPGFGYKIAPKIEIIGDTSGAEILANIDEYGRVVSCTIENPGYGYSNNQEPILQVRPYSVLVLADNFYNGKWTVFSWNTVTGQWVRARTQQYNTPLYWKFVDWVSPEYNQFIDYAETVNEVYQLTLLTDVVTGQYVKVKNYTNGRYIILRKTDGSRGTFDSEYDLMYIERGTIQILDTIWNIVGNDLSFDDIDSRFDQTLYDQTPDLELQFILFALRDDLFVNSLKVNWNLLFFKLVRYALTEQKLLDWAFKTSFINVTNFAGLLDQRPVYKLQDSQYYEDYLLEVKPYHTQVRSYTTNYEILEPTGTYTTDFDLPSKYNPNTGKFEVLDTLLSEYPWKAWNDNRLYSVGSISVGNPGSGYTFPPEVVITTSPGDLGSGATAKAYVSSGQISSIVVTNPGQNYSIAPTITLVGGAPTTSAVAYAQLVNGKVRTNAITLKFDRISRTSSIGSETATDTFICNGSANEFVLTWQAEPNKSKIEIILGGSLIPSSDYRIENYSELYNGYKKQFSKIVFINEVPSSGSRLSISYYKHIDLFNATERVENFYKPVSGMPGTLEQVISGIEYGKTQITSLPFDYTTRWDLEYLDGTHSKFDESAWADDIGFYKLAKTITTTTIDRPNVLIVDDVTGISVGTNVNVVSTQTTANVYGTVTELKVTAVNPDTREVSVSGLAILEALPLPIGQEVEFWTYDSNFSNLDSAIEGGPWVSSTATSGLADIVIDGDQFISPDVSYAPDELVPGHTADSIGINVYTRHVGITAPTVICSAFDIFAGMTSTNKLSILPPNDDSVSVTFNNKLFEYSTTTAFTTVTNSTKYTINWATGDLITAPQTASGKLGYTVITIGSSSPSSEIGVIDNQFTVSTGTSTSIVQSLSGTGTVKSAYVTVNGISIPELTTTTSLGYTLSYSTSTNRRAAVSVYNLSTGTVNTVQAWFFGNEFKYFNEVSEEIISYTGTQSLYELSFPPGEIEPVVAQTIVEVISTTTSFRLLPPLISYYEVTDRTRTVYPVSNYYDDMGNSPQLRDAAVRVYVNGRELLRNIDWSKTIDVDTVTIRNGLLKLNDVIAIVLPVGVDPASEFDVQGSTLTIRAIPNIEYLGDVKLRVITYNNHDSMLMRTERFNGVPNRRFKISRPVLNDNYLWVDLNGVPLINRIDFDVMGDQRTIQISDRFVIKKSDKIVINSLGSNKISADILGYRIFNDMFNRTHFERLSKKHSTILTRPLLADDTEIHVNDSSTLTPPVISKKMPGVVIIAGERIEFFKSSGNVLTQLRRSTLGTGPKAISPVGTLVIDQGLDQNIPFSEQIFKQTFWTTASTSTYEISTATQTVVIPNSTATIVSDGITLRMAPLTDAAISAKDQISVYYGGRQLRKDSLVYHDTTVSYDSLQYSLVGSTSTSALLPETSVIGDAVRVTNTDQIWVYTASLEESAINGYVYKGLNYLEPEFTVDAMTNSLVLNLPEGIGQDVKVEIVKKEFSASTVWNDVVNQTTTLSLMNSTTIPAKFIQSKPTELPNRYYYGR